MIYDIRHITRFDYGGSVKFARCNLRLEPIDWPGQRLERYALTVAPAGRLSPARAEAGLANVTRLVIDTPVRTLTIESSARVVVDRLVPVPAADDPTLAEIAVLARASRDLSAAGPAGYLYPSPLIPLDTAIRDYCLPDLDPARGALDAGIALARRIQRDFAFDAAATVVTTAPAEAFLQRRGVCQDFAQIMIAGPARRRAARGLCLGLYPHHPAPRPAAAGRRGCDACLGVAVVRRRSRLGRARSRPTASGWRRIIS